MAILSPRLHGDQDTYTPAEGARLVVEHLRATSTQPVAYAELHGAQHSFDLFHSIRFETIVDAIQQFTASLRTNRIDRGIYGGRDDRKEP